MTTTFATAYAEHHHGTIVYAQIQTAQLRQNGGMHLQWLPQGMANPSQKSCAGPIQALRKRIDSKQPATKRHMQQSTVDTWEDTNSQGEVDPSQGKLIHPHTQSSKGQQEICIGFFLFTEMTVREDN